MLRRTIRVLNLLCFFFCFFSSFFSFLLTLECDLDASSRSAMNFLVIASASHAETERQAVELRIGTAKISP